MRRNGFEAASDPILKPLTNIECRDAVLAGDGTRAEWPEADAVIGNPPFLGGKRLRDELGDDTVDRLFAAYKGAVRSEADLVAYWFAKSGDALRAGRVQRVGLVSTNSIRGGANRATLKAAIEGGRIFEAWDDEPWVVDGAASVDLTQAQRLEQNRSVAFMGDTKGGAFDVPGELAREWLALRGNLYNARPAWLAGLHARLDAAVAAAYGWDAEWQAGMDDEAILARLFTLNQARSG